jgi:tetratricopeptide (TPR) repeat protein
MGRIATFYSYKGGVGRTFALANIGVLMAKQGKRVLLMDWDLEAPGMNRYFDKFLVPQSSNELGTIFLLHEAVENENADWHNHVSSVTFKSDEASAPSYSLSLIASGVSSPEYSEKVRGFSWIRFIEEKKRGPVLERWRNEWKSEFDFVLLDSRTGITDTGGVCTVILPDILVLTFTTNDQSFEGALGILRSAQEQRRNLAVQRAPLGVLPLLSRYDGRDEISEASYWLKRIGHDLKSIYDEWLPKQFQPIQILELTKIPYVTRFSFGEPLPVLTHSLTDPELPGFYLVNAARLLSTDFQDAAQIIDPKASIPRDKAAQLRALAEHGPIDEVELNRLLRASEDELGHGLEFTSLLNEVGSALVSQAKFSLAEPLFRRALVSDQKLMGSTDPSVARDNLNLAHLLHATNRLTEAEGLMRRSLEIYESAFGSNSPQVAICINNLSSLLRDTNRPKEAEPLLRRALEIDEKTYGPEHPEVAIELNNLGSLLHALGQAEEAERLERRALAIDEKHFGPNHPKTSIRLNNLAHLLYTTNRVEEAEPLIRRAVAIDEESFGPDHPSVATKLNNLATLLKNTGRTNEAEPLMRRALASAEKNFGPEHPTVAVRLNNLANLLIDTNRSVEAEPLMRRHLVIFLVFTRTTGHLHPHLRQAVVNYRDLLSIMSVPETDVEKRLFDIAVDAGYDPDGARNFWQGFLKK